MRRRIVIGIAAGLLAIGGGSAFANPGNGQGHGAPWDGNQGHPAWPGLCNAWKNVEGTPGENGRPFQDIKNEVIDCNEVGAPGSQRP
jgi:hypothetical protein